MCVGRRQRTLRAHALAVLPIATLVILESCLDATAVRVHVYTDVAWSDGRTITITAAEPANVASAEPITTISTPWASTDLGDLVIVPSNDRTAAATVLVVMGVTRDPRTCTTDSSTGCIFARRRLTFVKHRTLTLPMTLYSSCIGIPCTPDTTCNSLGECVPADIAPERCTSPEGCFLEGEGAPAALQPPDSGTSSTTPADPDSGPALTRSPTIVSVAPVPVTTNVRTLAGSGTQGWLDGTGTAANFKNPVGLAVSSAGIVYVADQNNHRIRQISPLGEVTTLAGSGTQAFADGTGAAASFSRPVGVEVAPTGDVYVADTGNCRVRLVTPAGDVTTIAGSGTCTLADGVGTGASFNNTRRLARTPNGDVYVVESNSNRIRKISSGNVVTTVAGTGATLPYVDGPAATATFNNPSGVAADASGNVYIADSWHRRIRVLSPAGIVTTLAGTGADGFVDGPGTSAQFSMPYGITVDAWGNVYVADAGNYRIRRITQAGNVTTFAGSGVAGYADGPGTTAMFDGGHGVAVDPQGNVYVAESANARIRVIEGTGMGQLTVRWDPPTAADVAVVEYTASASAAGQPTQTCTTQGETTCTIRGLTSDIAYSVSVTATEANGTRASSATMIGTPN